MWKCMKILGNGGFGEVKLWKNISNNQMIAIKTLKENKTLKEDQIFKIKERWMKEHQCLNEIQTDFIVSTVQIDSQFLLQLNAQHVYGLPVIVMEYCNGGDLRKHLDKSENMNGLIECEVRQVMISLRYAIEYMHRKDIQHRDLKPDNIVIHYEGNRKIYKLTDFGFARELPENTIMQSRVGTMHYFAPEIVDSAKYNYSVDYWSAGVIAFELMTGRLPFLPHQSLPEIIHTIKKKPSDCIAITEDANVEKKYHFHNSIFNETRMSVQFRRKMENWLRLTFCVDHKQRGIVPDEVQPRVWANNHSLPRGSHFYKHIDEAVNCKILTVFCIFTCQFYTYEITQEMSFAELLPQLQADTKSSYEDYYFIFPIGHPHKKLSAQTRPIDLYVEEWAISSESSTPLVMLYLAAINCEFTTPDPIISDTMKHCLDMKSVPQSWLTNILVKETHFLLNMEQLRLQNFIKGLNEYAISLEQEIVEFEQSIEKTSSEFDVLRGMVNHFGIMIDTVKRINHLQLPSEHDFYPKWIKEAETFSDKIKKLLNLVIEAKHRYKSVLRCIKAQANNDNIAQMLQQDYLSLDEFRKLCHRKDINRMQMCENHITSCLEKRSSLMNSAQFLKIRDDIFFGHKEFMAIMNIFQNLSKYLHEISSNVNESTIMFHNDFIRESQRNNSYQLLDQQMNTLALDGSAERSIQNSSYGSFNPVSHNELIYESLQIIQNLEGEMDENMNELPAIQDLM